jgi:hypothetical protein
LLTKIIAVYFLIISIGFYFLWLSEIIPSVIKNTIPESLTNVGMATNPIHVLDLSIFLPAFFITGILLFRKQASGFTLTPVFLIFCILMNITIATLQVMMIQRGIESGLAVTIVMSILAIFNGILLVDYLKNT